MFVTINDNKGSWGTSYLGFPKHEGSWGKKVPRVTSDFCCRLVTWFILTEEFFRLEGARCPASHLFLTSVLASPFTASFVSSQSGRNIPEYWGATGSSRNGRMKFPVWAFCLNCQVNGEHLLCGEHVTGCLQLWELCPSLSWCQFCLVSRTRAVKELWPQLWVGDRTS